MGEGRASGSGEDALIARYFRPVATDPGAFGLRDDAAILMTDGRDLVVTVDAVVAGVHFLPDDPPDTIARKALRVNLSDLAAKGAEPAGFVVTLALREVAEDWLAPFARALGEDAAMFGCPLLGGDTVSTPGPVSISITAFGRVPAGAMVQRWGAVPGDHVLVTGTIGDAALGLRVLQGRAGGIFAGQPNAAAFLADRYRVPQPRTALAEAVRLCANAAMDVSDGLAGDLAKLCGVSGVSARIEAEAVPLSAPAREAVAAGAVTLADLVSGGDDYEILCTVPDARLADFLARAQAVDVPVMPIGRIADGEGAPQFIDAHGAPLPLARLSYSHF